MSDTIAAIATGSVLSAIGIIRVTGSKTIPAVSELFRAKGGLMAENFEDRKLYYGDIRVNGRVLDRCMCTVSRGPHSYTGEDTAELQCHGSPVVLAETLSALLRYGIRQAGPGEFTKRAFINGKMDLVQAEAVIDLINAETADVAVNAAGQLAGAVSGRTDVIYNELTDIMAHFHAVLDYSDEDIEPFEIHSYAEAFREHIMQLKRLESSFSRGSVMKNGVKCAIVGRPNVGKSSLLNTLLGYDRAIVTDIPGTTRDTIEEQVRLRGVRLRITDTAGLRETNDPVEMLGVERSRSAMYEAGLVLAVFDGSRALDTGDMEAITAASGAPYSIAVINKADLTQVMDTVKIEEEFQYVCRVSSLRGTGLDKLEQIVAGIFDGGGDHSPGEVLTNPRHYDAVMRAGKSLESAVAALEGGVTPDAVLLDIEDAMGALGELTGKTVREDITARIFERFCVGK